MTIKLQQPKWTLKTNETIQNAYLKGGCVLQTITIVIVHILQEPKIELKQGLIRIFHHNVMMNSNCPCHWHSNQG